MDTIIDAALQKWPQVPNCYGWLNFDRRGEWRIQNEYAQQHKLPGELITHQGFKSYIEAHLAHDMRGNYFFSEWPTTRIYSFCVLSVGDTFLPPRRRSLAITYNSR